MRLCLALLSSVLSFFSIVVAKLPASLEFFTSFDCSWPLPHRPVSTFVCRRLCWWAFYKITFFVALPGPSCFQAKLNTAPPYPRPALSALRICCSSQQLVDSCDGVRVICLLLADWKSPSSSPVSCRLQVSRFFILSVILCLFFSPCYVFSKYH